MSPRAAGLIAIVGISLHTILVGAETAVVRTAIMRAMLLTGDAEDKTERMMMESGRPLQSLVFKAGHHGSRSSSSRVFLQAVQPQLIIISASKDNRYGHPHEEVLERVEEIGATMLRTDELGSIELISDSHKVWWETTAD